MRINARLDADVAQKFRHLLEMTQQSQTEVLKEAIVTYHRDITSGKDAGRGGQAAKILKHCGFVACSSGKPNLSRDYKKILTRHFKGKI